MEKSRDTPSGKMFAEHSVQTEERTLTLFSMPSSAVLKMGCRCLRLKREFGQKQTYFWETDGAWLIELSTRNIGVYHSVAQESTLSQILMERVPEKYYLSPKACQGILRRASARGKELPEVLRIALERQSLSKTMQPTAG